MGSVRIKLKDVAFVKAGHPFRGAITELPSHEGNGYVIQLKNIDNDGVVDWSQLTRTNITGRKIEFLKDGDVLFVARGSKIVSAAITEPPVDAVSSQHFFVISLKQDVLLPEFLAWQLNQETAQKYFQSTVEGSVQVSIKKNVLEDTVLTVPSLETQQSLTRLIKTAQIEKQLLNELINNRQKQITAIAANLLKQG